MYQPKYKVGDWVIDTDEDRGMICTYYIKNVSDDRYTYDIYFFPSGRMEKDYTFLCEKFDPDTRKLTKLEKLIK